MEELTGRIINIQKCSIHDGRGMRTTVFFKGCGLHCLWCANPESIHFYPEVSLNTAKCMGCGFCAKMCKSGAVTLGEGEQYSDYLAKNSLLTSDMNAWLEELTSAYETSVGGGIRFVGK